MFRFRALRLIFGRRFAWLAVLVFLGAAGADALRNSDWATLGRAQAIESCSSAQSPNNAVPSSPCSAESLEEDDLGVQSPLAVWLWTPAVPTAFAAAGSIAPLDGHSRLHPRPPRA